MADKATKAEIAQRVNDIYTLIIAGTDPGKILQYATEKYGVTERSVYTYIGRATARIEKYAETSQKRELGKAITRLNDLYQSAYRLKDYRTCLTVQKELNTLLGLYAPTRTQVSGTGKDGALEVVVRYVDTLNDANRDD